MGAGQEMIHPAAGPREEAPGGVGALVCGILGLTALPFILSIVGVILANGARRVAREQPQRYKADLATVGLILGWIGIGMALIGLPLLIGFILLFL